VPQPLPAFSWLLSLFLDWLNVPWALICFQCNQSTNLE
jgi:hypothetical protein